MSSLLPNTPIPDLSEPLWFSGPETPQLPAHEIHVWHTSLITPGVDDMEGIFPCPVSIDRAEKVQLALFKSDILRRYTDPNARFAIAGPSSAIKVVVANCDHVALIAVSRDVRRVGIDVERVLEDIPIEEIAGGFFDAQSQWDLRVTWSPQEKAWKFFQFWTSNEACDQALTYQRTSDDCQVRGFTPEADFIAALAVEGGPEPEVVFWDWVCRSY